MSMRQKRLQRRVLNVIRGWNDAHGTPLQNLIEGMEISDDATLTLHVCPSVHTVHVAYMTYKIYERIYSIPKESKESNSKLSASRMLLDGLGH